MKSKQVKMQGVTLIEILLVLVVIGTIMYMAIGYLQQQAQQSRIDKTVIQMQQALNGGLAYYVANGTWPENLSCLQGQSGCAIKYLPQTFNTPWGGDNYQIIGHSSGLLYIYFNLSAGNDTNAIANIIAGKLPLGYASNTPGDSNNQPKDDGSCSLGSGQNRTCYVVAAVNIPGQNLNNATAINFAGVYTNGGCVPVPECPVDSQGNTMIPEIIIAPVSVSGMVSFNNLAGHNPSKVTYNQSITSFTAYATTDNQNGNVPTSTTPYDCGGGSSQGVDCSASEMGKTPAKAYWRACLQVTTEKGDISQWSSTTNWGKSVTLMAVTRCSINNETSGSGFKIFSNQ